MKRRSPEQRRPQAVRRRALCCLVWLLVAVQAVRAQDAVPPRPVPDKTTAAADTLPARSMRTDTVAPVRPAYPAAFRQPGDNVLTDGRGVLDPFWEQLRLRRIGIAADTLRIVHIGDSHIRGHVFPRTAGEAMQRDFGAVGYTDVGIDGASCITFARPDRVARIAALHPDLLILSFGTNESHNRRYDPMTHYAQMDELVRMLRERLPQVPMLMTTPPGSYESFRQSRRRRSYKVNPRTGTAAPPAGAMPRWSVCSTTPSPAHSNSPPCSPVPRCRGWRWPRARSPVL